MATRDGCPRLGAAAAVSIGCAVLLLTHVGYRFEQYDQLQYLLLPYRQLDPQFALGDWFTWQTAHYHVSFAWLVTSIHGLAALLGPGAFPDAMFGAHLMTLLWLGYAIFRLSESWGTGALGACLAVLVFAMIRHHGIGGATFTHGHLLPADLALPPLLLALSAWLRGQRRVAGLHLGISGLLHANFAVLGPLVIAVAELPGLWRQRQRIAQALRPVVEMAALYLVIAAPTLWMVLHAFSSTDSSPEAVDIIFELRSPHHYALSAMSPADLWWPLVLGAWGLPGWLQTIRDPDSGRHRNLGLALLAVMMLGLLGTLLSVGSIIRLFAWRVSTAMLCLLLFEVARSGIAALRARSHGHMALWLVGLACASTFGRSDLPLVAGGGLPEAIFGLPAVVLLCVGGAVQMGTTGRPQRVLAIAALLCLGWAGHAWAQPVKSHLRGGRMFPAAFAGPRMSAIVRTGADRRTLRKLYSYIREKTPVGSRFLIPPHIVDFRMAARRAVFVDFKAAPMRGDEALEWRRRMRAAAGVERFKTRGYLLRYDAGRLYAKRPMRELVELARREGLDYILSKHQEIEKHHGLKRRYSGTEEPRIYRKPVKWVLYEVLDE